MVWYGMVGYGIRRYGTVRSKKNVMYVYTGKGMMACLIPTLLYTIMVSK